MNKEKQIEEMAEIMRHSCEKDCKRNKYGEFDCEFCEAELLYNAGYRKQSEWISVDERLPEKHGRYLATFTDSMVDTVTYTRIGWFYGRRCSITHWMPLPEPPKGE